MKRLRIFTLFFILVPAIVYAHVYLRECSPAIDEVLTSSPKKVIITFVGSVEPAFSRIEVFNEEGKKLSKKTKFLEDDTVMEVELSEVLKSGTYTVKWLCVSLDGHKQTGSYKFTIK